MNFHLSGGHPVPVSPATDTKTTIDWLRFRTQARPETGLEALRPMFGALGTGLRLEGSHRGILGFASSAKVTFCGMHLGRVDFGGESQRGWARWDFGGQGLDWVQDWEAVQNLASLPDAEIRRLDIALTTWHGEVLHDDVVKAHEEGRFSSGGRPPALRQIISSDPTAGRTCEVGKREGADKFFRGYEKGWEMAARGIKPDWAGDVALIRGCPVEDIYRCEVEFKAENRPISWEVIPRRDAYFAGAYPFLADLLPGVEPDTLNRGPTHKARRDLSEALDIVRNQFGTTLFTALVAHGGDIGAVWELIVGDKHCQRLVEAGVLLVDHSD